MNNKTEQILQRYIFAQDLIKKVGEIAYQFYINRDQLAIECKKGERLDLVSLADKEIEKVIKNALYENFPNDGFLGEETGENKLENSFCWVVDPIDGTNPFLFGLHAWCISIGIIYDNEVVAGVIFDPLHDELFHACLNNGAFLNNKPIKVMNSTSLQDGLMGMGMSHRRPSSCFIPVLNYLLDHKGMFVRNGSGSLTLAYVAAGRLIGYFEPQINSWDVCAGLILLKEAGGISNNFFENNGLIQGNFILATANSTLYQELEPVVNLALSTYKP